jgi:hypothetical protein
MAIDGIAGRSPKLAAFLAPTGPFRLLRKPRGTPPETHPAKRFRYLPVIAISIVILIIASVGITIAVAITIASVTVAPIRAAIIAVAVIVAVTAIIAVSIIAIVGIGAVDAASQRNQRGDGTHQD